MVGGVHVEVIPLGTVRTVRAGHATVVHVVEYEVAELGNRERRRLLGGFRSERGSHGGVIILFSRESEGKEGKF